MVNPIKENKYMLRYILLHEYNLYRNAAEAFRNITSAWGEGTISESSCRIWFRKFRSGDTSLEDLEGRRRISDFDGQALRELVEENLRQSEREIANNLGISVSTISRHLKKINNESY